MSAAFRPSIVVDFDGTICEHEFPKCGRLKDGVKEALEQFRAQGFYIIISSCRTCHFHYEVFGGEGIPVRERPTVIDMVKYLDDRQLPYDEIDYGEKGKPLGEFYLDDRGIHVDNNWPQIAAFIAQRGQVWHTPQSQT